MADYDDLPYIVIERRSGGAGAFLWGVLLGAGAALLLAPRSGAETQEEMRRAVRRVRDAAQGRVDDARETVTGTVTRTRNRFYDRIDNVRETVESQAARARDAMETGRRAARDARSELERRLAEATSDAGAGDSRGRRARPTGDVVVTDVVEEVRERPELG